MKKEGPVRISITRKASEILWTYVEAASGEMSVLGLVDEISDNDGKVTELRIVELILPKQTNTQAETDIDDDSLNEITYELSKRDDNAFNKMRAWIHSHGTMETFWSGTDTSTIAKWKPDKQETPAYLVSLVVNKKHSYKLRLDVFVPETEYTKKTTHVYNDLILHTYADLDVDLRDQMLGELQKASKFVDTPELFTEPQENLLNYVANACVREALNKIEAAATVLLASDKRLTKKQILKATTNKNNLNNALKSCVAKKRVAARKAIKENFNATDILYDVLLNTDEETHEQRN